jgi:alpha-1,4-digalacturonate transport system substrate-binding protein
MRGRSRRLAAVSAAAIAAATGTAAGAVRAAEVTIWCDDQGFGCPTMQPIVDKYNAIDPEKQVRLEQVTYQTIVESLPVQLQAGSGPDGAIITDLGGLSPYYVDLTEWVDAERFEADFGRTLQWLRGSNPDGDEIFGMPTSLTVNGAYVNLTLFEQAGVEVPGEGATWAEWAEAAQQVAEATGTDFAMEMDRSGHRFASLAISYGAEMVDGEGMPVADDGMKAAIEQFAAWHEEGVMPMDLWGAVGGATHRELFSDFLNANVVFYFGGSWTLSQMDSEVGDLFDWEVVPAPCGPASCTVMPGGGSLVAFKHSAHPEIVGDFINFLSMPENYEAVIAAAVEIPAAKGSIERGIDYPGASERTQEALTTFTNQIPKMADAAFNFQGWRFQRAMMNAETTRISQVLNGEMDVDTALERIKQDVELAIEAAQ